jgi:class 3 adenylate cyclase
MNTSNDLATEQQMSYLREFGYALVQPLTKGEAAHLISDLEAFRQIQTAATGSAIRVQAGLLAHQHRLAVEHARLALAETEPESMADSQEYLSQSITARQEFWRETCHELTQMRSPSPEILELHKTQGYRFCVPSHAQVEEVMEALDSVIAFWDRDHPELFYQTLELNFPELLRQR